MARDGHLALVNMLLQKGANRDSAQNDGFTPLRVAKERGYQDVVDLLLTESSDL